MNNLKVKGFDNLEKDPESGAILLAPSGSIVDIKLDNLMRKLKKVEKQNEEILTLLRSINNNDIDKGL